MGLLDWLFRSTPSPHEWRISERGNATTVVDGVRITVFPQDGGWKYVLGWADDEDDEEEPFFSDRFDSEDEAKASALSHVEGR